MDMICYFVFDLLCFLDLRFFVVGYLDISFLYFLIWLFVVSDCCHFFWILCFCFLCFFGAEGGCHWKRKGVTNFFKSKKGITFFFFNLRKGMWFVYVFHIWERCHHGGCVGVVFVGFHRCHHRGSCSGVTSIDPWWL